MNIDSLRFPDQGMHGAVLSLLEFFEIVYKLRTDRGHVPSSLLVNDEQMFFVPSLLLEYTGEPHPSIQYWQQIDPRYLLNCFNLEYILI